MAGGRIFNRTGGLILMLAAAFVAGILVSGLWDDRQEFTPLPDERGASEGRELYSPSIATDPAFRAQQRKNVEALEQHCRTTSEMCEEARAARAAFERLGKPR